MGYEADLLVERKRLRRRLFTWRVLTCIAFVILVIVVGLTTQGDNVSISRAHVARVKISGLIVGDQRTLDLLEDLRKNSAAKAVVVRIDSPGGTTAGSEAVYDGLRRLSADKPVVAVVDTLAASGGYIAALGADRIFVRETSLVGSIGVLFQFPNVSGLLRQLGIEVEEIKSSPLKAAPSSFEPTSPQARAAIESLVKDSFDWFKRLVRERRHYDDAGLSQVVNGRVFTGRQGIELKLVDALGGEREALTWLSKERGIDDDLPIKEWRKKSEDSKLGLLTGAAWLAQRVGFEQLGALFYDLDARATAQRLDGLLTLWHPGTEK